jgi:ribonuclease E
MKKKILINAKHPEEKRVAIVEGQRLTDFYVEVSAARHLKGNVYKGVITGLERGLQAAFVDFGQKKHGFLPLRDVMPENYRAKPKGRSPQIGEVLAKGQELIVQVEQDQRGAKGARLTNHISLPGRYLVMMPGKERVGISRKIEDKEARESLMEAFKRLKVSKNMGFILRTAGVGRKAEELSSDLKYLTKLWNKMRREAKTASAPCLIYKEEDIAVRTVRDYLAPDVSEVLVDEVQAYRGVKSFLKKTMPWRAINVIHYRQKKPLFDQYDLEDQIALLGDRQAVLPSGGSIVIDRTEALTAIDVNSGKSKKGKNPEALALRTNLEAADEIARQLRLRDIGGLIQKVEEQLRNALDFDKAHYDITRISMFGILEMSRERMRTAYFEASRQACPTCGGAGVVKPPELVAISALREIHSRASREGLRGLTCRLPVESANCLINQFRVSLTAMEKEFSVRLTVHADPALPPGEYSIEAEGAEPEGKKADEPEKEVPKESGERKPKKARRVRRRPARKEKLEETPASGKQGPEPTEPGPDEAGETPAEPERRRKRKPRRPRSRRAAGKEIPSEKSSVVEKPDA